VRHFFEESEGTYGYRRIHTDLVDEGTECSPELTRQIMRQEGLLTCQPRPFKTTTLAEAEAAAAMPALVQGTSPRIVQVSSLLEISPTSIRGRRFIYLATVIDCYSKKVVGWAIEDHMRAELVEKALRNAADTSRIEPNAISHSDRGSDYTSASYRALVARLGMRSSMGKIGICWDNSQAETFFPALKNERVYRTTYATSERARKEVIRCIKGFCNSRRRHSALNYRPTNEAHYSYQQPVTAAKRNH